MIRIELSASRSTTLVLGILLAATTGTWLASRVIHFQGIPLSPLHTSVSSAVSTKRSTRVVEDALVGGERLAAAQSGAAVASGVFAAETAVESAQGRRLHGRALGASDDPIAGLPVWLVPVDAEAQARGLLPSERLREETLTDARGEFEFPEVAGGAWLVGPAPEDTRALTADASGITPMASLIHIRADEAVPEIELRLQRGLRICGRVLLPDGTPASTGRVSARSRDALDLRFAATGSDGSFALEPLLAGRYELIAEAGYAGLASNSVLAFAGEDGVVLQLGGGGALSGRVRDARSGRSDSVLVLAMRQDVEAYEILSTPTEPDESFALDDVPPGRYQVLAVTDDGWFAVRSSVDVFPGRGAEDVDLELREGGRLLVHAEDGELLRIEIRQGDVLVCSRWIEEPDTSIALPAGRAAVRWLSGTLPAKESEIEVLAGTEQKLSRPK